MTGRSGSRPKAIHYCDKLSLDMTKTVANTPAAAQLKGQKLEFVQTFKSWKIDTALDGKTFTFEPPTGSQKADSLMEAVTGGGQDRQAPRRSSASRLRRSA